jgi:hypothetical protein
MGEVRLLQMSMPPREGWWMLYGGGGEVRSITGEVPKLLYLMACENRQRITDKSLTEHIESQLVIYGLDTAIDLPQYIVSNEASIDMLDVDTQVATMDV